MAPPDEPVPEGSNAPAPPGPPPSADLGPRALAAGGWALFLLLVIDRVGQGPLRGLDEAVLRAIPHTGPLHTVSSIATHLGDQAVLVALTLLGTAILLFRRAFIDAGILALAKSVSVTVIYGLKFLFERARPAIGPEAGMCCAFPSGHAADSAMVLILLSVLLFDKRERVRPWTDGIAIGLALVIGATRTILAVHYPTDVVAGWGLGWGLAGTFLLLRAYLHRRTGHAWTVANERPAPAGNARDVNARAAPGRTVDTAPSTRAPRPRGLGRWTGRWRTLQGRDPGRKDRASPSRSRGDGAPLGRHRRRTGS